MALPTRHNMASVLDERWKPLVSTPSKPAIPSNILVPDPSPARSEVSDTDSPTLLPPSPVCSFIHQRRQGQYVPRPPVWKIDSTNQHGEGLIKAGACANSLQDKPTKFDWVLPLPGSDQYDPVQLMADVFNEKPLTVNILTLPETEHTNGIPPTEPVAGSEAPTRQRDVHDTLHTSVAVEQAQRPNETPQTNQENHDPLKQSAAETRQSNLAKRHAELFANSDPFDPKAQSAQPPPVTEADLEGPNQPLGMYPAGEARFIDTNGVDSPVYPYDSISNHTDRSGQPGDAARSQAQTSCSYPLSLSGTEEVVIGSQSIALNVQWPMRGSLKTIRLNVKVVPGRYTAHSGPSLEEGTGGDTQAATNVLGKIRGSLGRFRQKVSRGKLGSLKFSRHHPEYIEVNSIPSDAPRNDPPVPARAIRPSSSDAYTDSSRYPKAQQDSHALGTFFDGTAQQPVSRSGNVPETYKPTMASDDDDTKTLHPPPSPRDTRGCHNQPETDQAQSHNRNPQPPSVRRPTGIQTGTQSGSTQRSGNFSWPLPSPTGQRADLPNGVADENEPVGAAL